MRNDKLRMIADCMMATALLLMMAMGLMAWGIELVKLGLGLLCRLQTGVECIF